MEVLGIEPRTSCRLSTCSAELYPPWILFLSKGEHVSRNQTLKRAHSLVQMGVWSVCTCGREGAALGMRGPPTSAAVGPSPGPQAPLYPLAHQATCESPQDRRARGLSRMVGDSWVRGCRGKAAVGTASRGLIRGGTGPRELPEHLWFE